MCNNAKMMILKTLIKSLYFPLGLEKIKAGIPYKIYIKQNQVRFYNNSWASFSAKTKAFANPSLVKQ